MIIKPLIFAHNTNPCARSRSWTVSQNRVCILQRLVFRGLISRFRIKPECAIFRRDYFFSKRLTRFSALTFRTPQSHHPLPSPYKATFCLDVTAKVSNYALFVEMFVERSSFDGRSVGFSILKSDLLSKRLHKGSAWRFTSSDKLGEDVDADLREVKLFFRECWFCCEILGVFYEYRVVGKTLILYPRFNDTYTDYRKKINHSW